MWVPGRRLTISTIWRESSALEAEHQRAVGDGHVLGERALAGADRAGHHRRHPRVALQLLDLGGSFFLDADLGHQSGDRRQRHPGLAERRKDLIDVTKEERIRADDEDALALEGEPVGVEEVGRAVERDRGLAGARAALDDEQAGERRTDDLVLFALDGGDDVGHLAGAGPVEGGQQRGRAADRQLADQELAPGPVPGVALGALLDPTRAEALVLDSDHLAPVEGEVPPEDQALGIPSGRPVERLGDRGAPVDDQRLVVGIVDGQAPDVEDLGRRLPVRVGALAVGARSFGAVAVRRLDHAVDPAEGECLVADVELFEAGEAGPDDHVPLGARLEGAAPTQVEDALEHGVGVAAHGVEPRIRRVDERLLGLSLRVHPHLRSLPLPARAPAPPGPEKPSIVGPGCASRVRRAPPLAEALS